MTLFKVSVPKGAKVLLLEDSDMRINWFKSKIPEGLFVFKTLDEFKAHFENKNGADFIFWDHDLGPGGSGYDAAKYLTDKFGSRSASKWGLIHSWNVGGANRMRELLPGSPHIPFGDFEIEMIG